jgi:PAS domain S-box-containing protein
MPQNEKKSPASAEKSPRAGRKRGKKEKFATSAVIKDAATSEFTAGTRSEAEARILATVLKASSDAVLLLDQTGKIALWNSGATRMYGYTEAEALQMNLFQLIPSDYQEVMQEVLEQIRNGKSVESFESQRVTKEGRVLDVWLTITAVADHENVPACVATTERDITDRKQNEKAIEQLTALRAAEHHKVAEELRAILDASRDTVITINQQGIIVSLNATTEKMFGYPEAELLGQNIRILMPAPHHDRHDQYLARYLETGEAHIIATGREVDCRRKDGSLFPADLTVSVVDHLGLFTGVIRDVSERRHMQNEILRSVSEEQRRIAQDLHDTAGQDVTGLSYLIRNNLAFLRKLNDPDSSNSVPQTLLAEEISAMENANHSIRSLQRKIRTVIRGLAPVDISADGLRASLLDLTAGIQELHPVKCEFHCDPPILIDDNTIATHLYRIAQEAINNAIRHAAASHISVALESEDHHAVLTVSDDGCGIDERKVLENGGFGLRIMSYRARLIGADFAILAGDDGGTIIRCRLPQIQRPAR